MSPCVRYVLQAPVNNEIVPTPSTSFSGQGRINVVVWIFTEANP